MSIRPIVRTEYRVPGGSGAPRQFPTMHAESAVDVDNYLQALEQVHGSAHGVGVVEGMEVSATAGATAVRIAPGVAIDGRGRHIALVAGGLAEISAKPATNSTVVPVDATGVDLPTTGQRGSVQVTVQWRETFDQDVFNHSQGKIYQDNHTPWLRFAAAGSPPEEDGLVLAEVTLDAGGAVVAGGLAPGDRHAPATATGALAVHTAGTATATGQLGVIDVRAGQLLPRPGGGLRLQVSNPDDGIELSAEQGAFAELSVVAGRLALRPTGGARPFTVDATNGTVGVGTPAPLSPVGIRASGGDEDLLSFEDAQGATRWQLNQNPGGRAGFNLAETGVADTRLFVQAGGDVGLGTTTPTHPLHVTGTRGIRQNALFLSGAPGWSSLSYNAHHDEANAAWVFPDPSRPAVTVEMDDNGSRPRFQVWSTTTDEPSRWRLRLAVDGATGTVGIPGSLGVGTTQPGAALEVTGGAIVNGVTAGVEGISSTSDPGRMAYPDAYETIGVSRPEYNLRLQSPNAVIVHTYDPGSGGYAPRLAVAGDRVTVGPGANGRLWSRHIDGKHFASDTNDGLFLNWDTGQPVHVGGGAAADLWVHGSFHWDGDQSGANYVRLGLMQLCWGEGSFGAVSGEYRIPVSFPVPFAGNPAVTASLDDPGYGKATCEGGLGAWQVNPSGFILLYKYNQSRTQTIYYSWIAVGRWA